MSFSLSRFLVPSADKVFRQMGGGIQKRNKIFRKYWQDHQQSCCNVQRDWIENGVVPDTAVIVGAGFLFDLDRELFAKSFRKLVFVDGNPKCQTSWRQFAKEYPSVEVEQRIEDVTAVIDSWKKRFLAGLKACSSWKEAMELLRSFSKEKLPQSSFCDLSEGNAVLSLNILSQIPLAWQEIVENSLVYKFGERFVAKREDEWIERFSPSAKLLVEQHLLDLSTTASFLLITDTEYCRYKIQSQVALSEPCVDYLDGQWRRSGSCASSDERLELEVVPALYGAKLVKFVREPLSWLWQISPPGGESRNNGIAHLVQAGWGNSH